MGASQGYGAAVSAALDWTSRRSENAPASRKKRRSGRSSWRSGGLGLFITREGAAASFITGRAFLEALPQSTRAVVVADVALQL